jgi:sugar O-acyltransferase (sialic acid O-acetyltransferase NeuD family)
MNISEKIVLYGAGGAGRELAYAMSLGYLWDVIGFVDDTKTPGSLIDELPVLGGLDWLRGYEGNVAICAVANPQIKRDLVARVKAACPMVRFPLIIDENSFVSPLMKFGEGCIVAQPMNHITVGVKIGNFVWINSYTGIGHESSIGDFTTIYTGIQIGGYVQIGKDCIIGTGAIIKPGVKIGDGVTAGAGAVVVKDVPPGVVVVGNPARIMESKGAVHE